MTVAEKSDMKQRGATACECPRGAVDISRKPIMSDERLWSTLSLCIVAAITEMHSSSCESYINDTQACFPPQFVLFCFKPALNSLWPLSLASVRSHTKPHQLFQAIVARLRSIILQTVVIEDVSPPRLVNYWTLQSCDPLHQVGPITGQPSLGPLTPRTTCFGNTAATPATGSSRWLNWALPLKWRRRSGRR